MNERTRLEQLIDAEQMTAKQFAQEVGIQAGTISNIMSGRNNPSLEVMQRVLNRFRTVSSDWLILGVGSMYRANNGASVMPAAPSLPEERTLFDEPQEEIPPVTIPQAVPQKTIIPQGKTVTKIVVFYSDNTFEER